MIGIMPTQMLIPRWQDDFRMSFLSHLAKEEERGSTTNITIMIPTNYSFPGKERLKILIKVKLRENSHQIRK
jgi:hypothetical protein